MEPTVSHTRTAPAVVVGVLFVAAGIAALALREAGVDVARIVGEAGWPIFVIVPGLVLLGAAFVPQPPKGIGFAIAGSIVTTVGLLLWYQARTGDWESWAYLWALIPLAIGAALLTYGELTHQREMVRAGVWVGGVATILLAAGAWYFESIFAGRGAPLVSGDIWPIAIIAIGAVIVVSSLRPKPR